MESDVKMEFQEDCPKMCVKSGSKIENMLGYARKVLNAGEKRKIMWTGSGDAITRTISCAECVRREFKVHQVTQISQDVKQEAGKTLYIPNISILQSLDQIDPSTSGYQSPEGGSTFCQIPSTDGSCTSNYPQSTKRRKIDDKEDKE
uniref:Putative ribonuclease p protein n=1 Tax=Nyssomyia neivai TaxID=330878 RepID=A0A1L8DXH2_9DIPT